MVSTTKTLTFDRETDAIWCRRVASEFASDLGFDRDEAWEISIAVSELVTNAIKYAGGGRLTLNRTDSISPGIWIQVDDDGPGCEDIQSALADGFSEGRQVAGEDFAPDRRGLGSGLGAVQRLTDTMEFDNKKSGGFTVTIRKYLDIKP